MRCEFRFRVNFSSKASSNFNIEKVLHKFRAGLETDRAEKNARWHVLLFGDDFPKCLFVFLGVVFCWLALMKEDEAQSEHVPFMYLLVMLLICCKMNQLILHFTARYIDSVSVKTLQLDCLFVFYFHAFKWAERLRTSCSFCSKISLFRWRQKCFVMQLKQGPVCSDSLGVDNEVFTRVQWGGVQSTQVRICMWKMDSLLPLQFILFISVSDLLMDRSFDCLSIPWQQTHTHTRTQKPS